MDIDERKHAAHYSGGGWRTSLGSVYESMSLGRFLARPSVLTILLLGVLLFGALYSHHVTTLVSQGDPGCSTTSLFNCSKSLLSGYGQVLGLPVSVFATAFFVFLLVHSLLAFVK